MKNFHLDKFKWYKGEKDLAPCPHNPNTQLHVMYRALYECSKSHSGTVKDVVFMLACIEASGEMPEGIRPIKLNKHGSSHADITKRLRDLLYRGYVRQINPVNWNNNQFVNSYPKKPHKYFHHQLLENVVWRIATREEYKEVNAIYEAQRWQQQNKSKKVSNVTKNTKAFTDHVADIFPLHQGKPELSQQNYVPESKAALKAQAIAEVRAEMKESQIRILKHVLSFVAGAAITFILTLLGRML